MEQEKMKNHYIDFGVAPYALADVCEALFNNGVTNGLLTKEDGDIHIRWGYDVTRKRPVKKEVRDYNSNGIIQRLEKQGANSVSVTKGNNSITKAEVVSHPTVTDPYGDKCTREELGLVPKYNVGNVLVNDKGESIKIMAIVADQYMFDCGDDFPHYDFFDCIESQFTPIKKGEQTMENKEMEIPFGANDSELIEVTYHIPDGMEAIIEGDKVIIRKKASKDEKIRKKLINLVKKSNEYGGYALHKDEADEMIAWLEKQKYSEFELGNEYWRGYDDAKFHLKEDKVTVIGAGSISASVSDGDNSITSKEVVSQQTGWSKEDTDFKTESVRYLCNLRDTFEENKWDTKPIQRCINWLLEFPKPQPKQEWSEEDEFCLNTILNILEQLKGQSPYEGNNTAEKCINFLRHKLKK